MGLPVRWKQEEEEEEEDDDDDDDDDDDEDDDIGFHNLLKHFSFNKVMQVLFFS